MLTVAIPKRNKLQNIIVLTPKDGSVQYALQSRRISFFIVKFKQKLFHMEKRTPDSNDFIWNPGEDGGNI